MPSRREFIQAGLAVSISPATLVDESASPARASDGAQLARHRLAFFVCDLRLPSSVALAREAERLGITVARTCGDITDFWFDDLSRRWKKAPVAIGGLTRHGPLFCLERFGWDHGLRVVFRRTHGPRAAGAERSGGLRS
jgi:hypothetical protein